MKIEKHGNKYRAEMTYKGKRYRATFDHKPTQKEALQALSEAMDPDKKEIVTSGTFEALALEFLDINKNTRSPSTLNTYRSILRNLSNDFKKLQVSEITNIDIQREINDYAETRSGKTVKNGYGFITKVLRQSRPRMDMQVNLPMIPETDIDTPIDEEVSKILKWVKGDRYEIALRLAVYGLRRSEIIAVKAKDIKKIDGEYFLHIREPIVYGGKDVGYVSNKANKTPKSTRTIYIDDELAEMILEQGYAYEGDPDMILKHLNAAQDALGIERFKLHCMRYYYVSMAHSLGIPDVYIRKNCGFSTNSTMDKVYKKAMRDKIVDMQKFASEYIKDLH